VDQPLHTERHYSQRIGWLRAAVLGANDGIVSTASLIVGVAAAGSAREGVLLAGVAGLVAGAMSMAAGEYVSVSSQADIEKADVVREQRELELRPEYEVGELQKIYVGRGLDPELASRVAVALEAHTRDELGFSTATAARPVQAALASAATFAVGAALPLVVAAFVPASRMIGAVSASALFFLAVLGSLAAQAGGAGRLRGALRVTFWGALAMALTAMVGRLFGTVV
jgi:VIT1/CCC1 family predicted Fe2+/Mn2+ transporter